MSRGAIGAPWPRKKITEIAQHSLGKMLDKAKNRGELRPYLRNLNVRWFEFDLSDLLQMRFLPEETSRYTAIKGDLLICEGGYPGRAAIWDRDQPVYFQKALHRVRFQQPEHAKWFLYYLYSLDISGELKTHFNGAGIQHFTGETLAQFEVPLAPLPEQHRIVGILDKAFGAIATAKANAEKNLQNAGALFESQLQQVFSCAWNSCEIVPLSGLATDITDGDHLPPPKSEDGVPFITISDIHKESRTIDFTNTFMVPRQYFQGLKTNRKPKNGDVLYTVTGSFGIPVIVDGNTEFCFQRHIGLVRPRPGIESRWLYYLLLSPQVFKQASDRATGTAQKTVSLKVLRTIEAPKANLAQQRSAVEILDAISTGTRRLGSLYRQKLATLDALKQSLLHQAFTGAL